MKNNLKLFFNFLVICTLAFSLCSCDSQNEEQTSNKNVLVMGVSPDYPPFETIQNGNIVGFDIDLANLIAKELGFELKIKEMDFNSLIPALQSKRIDFIMSSMTATEERAKNVDFTINYYNNTAAALLLEESEMSFDGKKIGAQMSSTMEQYLKNKQKEFPTLKIVSLPRIPQLIEEVKLGRIHALVVDAKIAHEAARKNGKIKFQEIQDFDSGNAIALRKNSKWTEKFSAAISKLRKNGEIKQLEDKWLKE